MKVAKMLKSVGIIVPLLQFMLVCCCAKSSSSPSVQILFPDPDGNYVVHTDHVDHDSVPYEDEEDYYYDESSGDTSYDYGSSLPSGVFEASVNSLTSIEDFVNYFEMEPPVNLIDVSNRFGASNSNKSIKLPQANCQLSDTTVQLDLPKEKGITYFPTCVRVPRCEGCCLLNHFSCQPVKQETINVKVMETEEKYTTNSNRKKRNRRPRRRTNIFSVTIERHLECECRCKLKKTECVLDIHNYDELACKCECKDSDKETSCLKSNEHYWNQNTCSCDCREEKDCSSSQSFDKKSCSCV